MEDIAPAANGAGAGQEEAAAALPEGQERLLFFAAVLIGHKVEVQVRNWWRRGLRWSGQP